MALESLCKDKKGVGGTFRSVVSEEAEGAVWLREPYREKQKDMRGGEFLFLFLVIKGFWGTA